MENENIVVDTLRTYGSTFQTKCISILISDKRFLERISDILSPDFFESDSQKWIVNLIIDYYFEYKEIATKEVFKVKIQEISDTNGLLKAAIFEEIKKIFNHITDTDVKFIKEQFLTFCKQMRLKTAILRSGTYLKSGDYENIKREIDAAMKAGIEKSFGHDYLNEVDKRMSQSARECIKTGWGPMDQIMNGGLGRGELGFIIAPSGAGKSWVLVGLGAEAMKQGKNVVHVTLELNENYVGLRYDSYFNKITFQETQKNAPIIKTKVEEMKNGGIGKLFIQYFPLKTASPQTLKIHIDRIQSVMNIKIDLLIVDYADILRPFVSDRNSNSYSEAGSVYEELRTIAGELQIPIWSASQANRAAQDHNIVQGNSVADSYRKIMTGDFIFSLSRKMEDKIASTGRIHIVKNRFGPDGITFPMEFDTGTGISLLYDQESEKGKELMAKTKDIEEDIRETLKSKWNEFKSNGGAGTDNN